MAASHVLDRFLLIYLVLLNIFYVLSLKKCADVHCKVPISIAVAVEDHQSLNENYLSFKKGDKLIIFSKSVGSDNPIWEGSLGGASPGFLKSSFFSEKTRLVSDDKLIDVASNNEGDMKIAENDEMLEESDVHDNEMEEEVTEIEDEHTDGLEDPDDRNDFPAVTTQDQTQAENNNPANEDKDNGKQDKITSDNERTVQRSESESSSIDVMEDESQNQKNENDNPQVAMANSERSKRTEVYTDPNGVQYDVEVAEETTQEANDEIQVVKITEQKLSDVDEDEELTGQKENGDVEEESAAGDKEFPKKERAGFFSSIGNIVSDFTGNIIKDFQGNEDENDNVTKVNEPTADPAAKSENIDEKAGEKENVKVDSREEESSGKPSEFKGLQEKFQQMKAAGIERMRENKATSDAKIPAVDEEDVLKQEAKKTVERIPGLMSDRVESDETSETKVSGDGQENEETMSTTQESRVETENQTPPRKYSDEVLCSSVAFKNREVCLESGDEKECLMDNCCFDKNAEPGKQCFFKPSSPESAFTEEHLISKEEEGLEKDNDATAAVETDANSLESSEQAKSTNSEKSDETEIDDQRRDKFESTTETKSTVENTDDEVDSRHVVNAEAVDSTQETSSEDDPTAEIVTASRNQAEETLPQARNVDDEKQEDVDTKDYEEIIEENTKSVSETEEDENYPKTREENDDGSEDNIDMQKSSDTRKDANLSDETTNNVESKEKQNDDLKSDDEPLTVNIEKEDPSKEATAEEKDVESRAKDVRSDHEDDSSLSRDSSTRKDDVDQQGLGSSAGLKDQKYDKEEATKEDEESVKRIDDREPKDSQKNNFKVESEGDLGEKDEMKSGDADRGSDSSSPEEASVSDESQQDESQSSEVHSAGGKESEEEIGTRREDETLSKERQEDIGTPREEETESKERQENIGTPREEETESKEREENIGTPREEETESKEREENIGTPREEETESKERQEEIGTPREEETESKERQKDIGTPATLVEEMSDENQEVLPDVDETKEAIYVEGIMDKLKMFLPGGENTTAKDRSSNDVKVSKDENVEKIHRVDDIEARGDENQKQTVDVEGIMDKIKKMLPGGGTEVDSDDKDLKKSENENSENILADTLAETSANTNVTTDTIIPETKDRRDFEERHVESGSTHFLNDTEPTLPVEKTPDKKPELNDGTSLGGEDTKTGIEETNIGVEETRTGIKPDIVPTQTSRFGSSETITNGHRPFEKKFPNIASKWTKNKLMKDKRIPEEDAEGTPVPADVKMDEDLYSGTKDSPSEVLPGTCVKDGTCEGTVTLSSSITRSLLEDDDDDIVEPRPEIEDQEPEVKSVKTQFLETLAVVVRKFREYHNVVADYGLQVLKPVKKVTKLLGEQMGLGKTIGYMERELKQGPQGVIAVTLIMIAFTAYLMLSVMCGKKVPPCYGPSLKDVFKTYEGRIRILEEECTGYEERINNLKNKANEDVENSSALEKQLDDEKHERSKSEEQISILKEIVKNLNEKVALLEEESSKLKQSVDEKTGRIATMEEQISEKSKEIETMEDKTKELQELLKEKDEEKSVLNENIDEYKKQLSKAEDDTDRHKTMLQDWNDRYHELEQKYDDISVSNQTLEEQIHFKDNEIEVLRDSLVQINSDVHINSDEELSQEEMQEARSTKIKELMDVSQIRTDYKLCKEEKEKLEDDIQQEMSKKETLEGEVEKLEIDLAKSKASEEEIRFKYREADIKLNALQDYFKNMESDLHRKLTAEEAARMASESELERKLREASTAVQDVELYRKQVEELRKEIDETQQAFRAQTSSTEERAHENWLKFRSAERELEETRRERDALRRRLYDLETSSKVVAPVADSVPITSSTAENLESPVTRSESPATSVRSSKRKNSNPRKSPSGSPLDERKERVRRKPRERNSPPSWEPDMGPRKRDKDRVTPPPPPPLWDPNMGLPSRRKGHSPIVPTVMDAERRRRDRYTPSPPPPPDTRRRRRDRPAPSSSPPPPPPPGMFSPKGGVLPIERPPPPLTNIPQFSVRGGPPRMNTPLAGKPPPADMVPQFGRGNINGVPFQEQSPSQMYIRRGGGSEVGVNTEMQRPPPMTRTAGPPTNVSPLRGTPPQRGTPNEQTSPYNVNSIANNLRGGDEPSDKPPPVMASNGPYPITPPRKIPTMPS